MAEVQYVGRLRGYGVLIVLPHDRAQYFADLRGAWFTSCAMKRNTPDAAPAPALRRTAQAAAEDCAAERGHCRSRERTVLGLHDLRHQRARRGDRRRRANTRRRTAVSAGHRESCGPSRPSGVEQLPALRAAVHPQPRDGFWPAAADAVPLEAAARIEVEAGRPRGGDGRSARTCPRQCRPDTGARPPDVPVRERG